MTSSPDNIQPPVHIVFGASGGIGSAVVQRLAEAGARVVLSARGEDRLRTLAETTGGLVLPADVTEYDHVQSVVSRSKEEFGRIDGVACCVGSILLKPAHLTSEQEFDDTLKTNLHAAFYTVKAAARAMMASGGSIVLCSSAVARVGLVNHEAIAAAKAGIIGLAQAAAATYAHRGVRVNCVAPGLVETPLASRILGSETGRAQSAAMHPLGRIGSPDDIAEAVTWLMDGSRSGWVTGQVIGVDGGLGTVRPR